MGSLIAGSTGALVPLQLQAGFGAGQQKGFENLLTSYKLEQELELARKQNSLGNILLGNAAKGFGGMFGLGMGAGAGAGIAELFGLGGAGAAGANPFSVASGGWGGAAAAARPSYAMSPLGLVSTTPSGAKMVDGTLTPTGGSTILEGHLPMAMNPFVMM